jgi:hypothetical protein
MFREALRAAQNRGIPRFRGAPEEKVVERRGTSLHRSLNIRVNPGVGSKPEQPTAAEIESLSPDGTEALGVHCTLICSLWTHSPASVSTVANEELARLLSEHRTMAWPETVKRGTDARGMDLVMLDADIVGYASRAQVLGVRDREWLSCAAARLEVLLTELPPEGRTYFERLLRIASLTAGATGGDS